MPRQHTPTELKELLKGTKATFIMLFFSCVINMLMLAPVVIYVTGRSSLQRVVGQVECSLFRGDPGGDGCSKMSVL